jgi:hypothetical protein
MGRCPLAGKTRSLAGYLPMVVKVNPKPAAIPNVANYLGVPSYAVPETVAAVHDERLERINHCTFLGILAMVSRFRYGPMEPAVKHSPLPGLSHITARNNTTESLAFYPPSQSVSNWSIKPRHMRTNVSLAM